MLGAAPLWNYRAWFSTDVLILGLVPLHWVNTMLGALPVWYHWILIYTYVPTYQAECITVAH